MSTQVILRVSSVLRERSARWHDTQPRTPRQPSSRRPNAPGAAIRRQHLTPVLCKPRTAFVLPPGPPAALPVGCHVGRERFDFQRMAKELGRAKQARLLLGFHFGRGDAVKPDVPKKTNKPPRCRKVCQRSVLL